MKTSPPVRRDANAGRAAHTACALVLLLATPEKAAAQDRGAAGTPGILETLTGDWTGSGTLLERSAVFTMSWRVDDSGFIHLAFSNAFEDEQGVQTPVLSARAVYRLDGETGRGVWLDSRPQQVMIEAHVTDSSFVSEWTAASEAGRTEYVVTAPGRTVVRDFVIVDGTERPFGEAAYTRN